VTELTMPKLSDSMEEGTILTWLRADGDTVHEGEDLVEIETDKATVTHPAEASGVLSIVAAEGTSLPVGATIARLGQPNQEPAPEVPAAAVAEDGVPDTQPVADSGATYRSRAAVPVAANGGHPPGPIKATPLARRIAAVHAIALDQVTGSGPLGRITRTDVLRTAGISDQPSPPPARAAIAIEGPAAVPPPAGAPELRSAAPAQPTGAGAPTIGAKGEVRVIEPTRLQTVVARRMAEAKATVPHFQVQTEVEMDAAIGLRDQLKHSDADVVPSFNDLIVKAAALALRAHPRANGAYREGRFEEYSRVNIGIAVAAQNALVVPTIFDADIKSLGAIAAEARRLASRVRDGTVTPPELGGATFTVSNLGMYGMTAITPVINVPQAAILGVGAVREVLGRRDREIVDRHLMTLTLSCDHRILYGSQAAEFLSTIRQLLEQPLRLAL
jgi:pyruvate dehydrogenase E2 component (dihydrolipoamide acetyltransferase)